MRRLVLATSAFYAAAIIALPAAPASAALVLNADGSLTASGGSGGSVTVDFDGQVDNGTTVIPGLTSSITYTFVSAVTSSGNTTYTFDYNVTNTSSSPITDSRVTIFGFGNVIPNVAVIDGPGPNDPPNADASGTFTLAGSGNVPTGFGTAELCFKDGGGTNNCSGGGNGGVAFGDSGSGQFWMTFTGTPASITLADLFVRYQGIEGAGDITSAIGRPTDAIPEPGTWAMLLLGFAGAGFAIRRSRRRSGEILQLA